MPLPGIALLFLLLLFPASDAFAAGKWTTFTNPDYINIDFWTGLEKVSLRSGGPEPYTAEAMTEDFGGRKWFATYDGIFRLDGSRRDYIPAGIDGPVSNHVYGCATDDDGNLWFSTDLGLSRFDGTTWKAWFTGQPIFDVGAGGGSVWTVCDDSSVARNSSSKISAMRFRDFVNPILYRFEHDSWIPHPWPSGSDSLGTIVQMEVAPDGAVWFGSYTRTGYKIQYQLSCYVGSEWRIYPLGKPHNSLGEPCAFTWDPLGNLWAVFYTPNFDWSVCSFDGVEWKWFEHAEPAGRLRVPTLAFDRNNVLWIGSADGVYSFHESRLTTYNESDGWPAWEVGYMRQVHIGLDGVKWLVTTRGVFTFDERKLLAAVEQEAPRNFLTVGNHPNPFNPSTTISFTLPAPVKATLTVYDITGRKVRTLVSGSLTAGAHSTVWDGKDERGKAVSSGVYIAQLRAGKASESHRMLLMK